MAKNLLLRQPSIIPRDLIPVWYKKSVRNIIMVIFISSRPSRPLLLAIAASVLLLLLPPLHVSVEALTRRPGAVSSSFPQRKGTDSVAVFVVSAPRGGDVSEESKAGVEAEADNDEEDETEVEEEIVEAVMDEIEEEEEIEELVGEVVEEVVEEAIEEVVEEEIEVVFPTDEIPSDDVRYFHTTDGELADDEGMYTDGQNESPIAENDEAEEDTIAATATATTTATEEAADDQEEEVEESAFAEATAVRAGASVAIIDEELKQVLIKDLRYTEEDVANMRPEIATEVVDNKLARPTEGMPKNWYSDSEVANKEDPLLVRKKGLIATVALVGAAALSVGVLKDNDAIGETVEEFVDVLRSRRIGAVWIFQEDKPIAWCSA